MNTAFLTESQFQGKWPTNFPNCRTEIAWQITLNSTHYNIHNYKEVKNYDAIFIIFPRGMVYLNTIGINFHDIFQHKLSKSPENLPPQFRGISSSSFSELHKKILTNELEILQSPIIETLRNNNPNCKICIIQEGNSDFFNEYDMATQFHFFNQLADCDIIFAHNTEDTKFYKGLFPGKSVSVIPSLMVIDKKPKISPKQEKAIIGGNMTGWYGGFQSYMVATEFQCPIYVPSSHCKQHGEEQIPDLNHLPWMNWNEWINTLGSFKYAVHLMPTVAAGTFSMNCGYWGIPCIGNKSVDTQNTIFPDLSVNVKDVESARFLSNKLKTTPSFYEDIAHKGLELFKSSWHFDIKKWESHMYEALNA